VLRHIALFRFADGVQPEQIRAMRDGLAGLPEACPSIRVYRFGPDLALRPGNADFAVVADFDDEAGWREYQENTEHKRVIAELIAPIASERTAVQIDIGEPGSVNPGR
jgi:hypothetical protein